MPKFLDRLTLLAIRAAMREVREVCKILKVGVDSYREAHHLPPVYAPGDPMIEPTPSYGGSPSVIAPGDYLSFHLIEELARENRIPYDDHTDLEALALDRGWLTSEGVFLMFPESAKQYGLAAGG